MTTDSAGYLRSLGVTPSPQRLAIYEFLRTHAIHPTADTIYNAVKPALPAMSRTTVYNTVKRLVKAGAVQEVIIEDGELRFDADMRAHGHFKCLDCGEVFDLFPAVDSPPVREIPGLPAGFQVTEIHLCCRGYCASCRKK